MPAGSEHERHLRYLLGEMPEPESETFEDDYFGSDIRYGELLASQDALVDTYLDGTLSPDRRQRFEERYLATPRGRQRFAVERALRRRAASGRPATTARPSPAWAWPAALAAAAVLIVAVGLAVQGRVGGSRSEREALARAVREHERRAHEQERELDGLRREIERLRRTAAVAEDVLGSPAGGFEALTLALTSSGRRDPSALPRLTLPADVSLVRLRLPLESRPPASLRASLQTAEGRELWSRAGLRAASAAGGAEVTFPVPAAVLAGGHYVVTLQEEAAGPGVPSVADYVFQVTRAR